MKLMNNPMRYYYETKSGRTDVKAFVFYITANSDRELHNIWADAQSTDQGKVALRQFLKANPDYDYRGSRLLTTEP